MLTLLSTCRSMLGLSTGRDLHHDLCTNRAEDIERMLALFERWRPESSARELAGLLEFSLARAVKNGHDVCVNFLYSLGATGNLRELLISATENSHLAVFEILLKKSCTQEDINASLKFIRRWSCLSTFEKDIIKLLLQHGFTYNASNFPSSKFYWSSGNSSMLKFALFNSTAVVEQQENLGMSLLQEFMKEVESFMTSSKFLRPTTAFEILQILRQCGANFAEIDPYGQSALDRVNNVIIRSQHAIPRDLNFYVEMRRQIQEYLSEPLSLQSLSRLSLMRHFKCHYMQFVDSLSLNKTYPPDLINFLKGDDIKVTELYSQSQKDHFKMKVKVSNYKALICRHENPSEISQFKFILCPSVENYCDDIDALTARLEKLEARGQTIMKCIYNSM